MSQNKNYYSKRNNRLTKKEFNKKNNIRSNSYSSRYINMYLTKEMDITPKHKKNILQFARFASRNLWLCRFLPTA